MYTDGFFSFPIKIYDGFSLKKAMQEEDASDSPVDADWAAGMIKIPLKEFVKGRVFWHEGFSKDRNVEDVVKEGFDTTIVYAQNCGEFTCTWPIKKFEARLNAFMERAFSSIPEQEEDQEKDLEI